MAKVSFTVLVAALACGLANGQAKGQLPGDYELNRAAAFVGSPLACSQPLTIIVPRNVAEKARLKVRLLTLLRESLSDDAKGIVNIAREKEIKKLANKLRNNGAD